MFEIIKWLVPRGLKHSLKMGLLRSLGPELKRELRDAIRDGAAEVMAEKGAVLRKAVLPELYDPLQIRAGSETYTFDATSVSSPAHEGGLPVPPPALRMGYEIDSVDAYLKDGARTAGYLREIFEANAIAFDETSVVLDWGCASGRVLRQFDSEARRGEFWGADQDETCMLWARENLSPPFRFVTCTAYPHLPFEDNTFSLVYGISVFTHIVYLGDAWLMELRRVMKPGAHLLLTVHTEASVDEFESGYWPPWLPRDADPNLLRDHDMTVLTYGAWDATYPFFKESWLREEWGHYFEIVEIRPAFVQYAQTAVLMRKPMEGSA